MQHHGDAAAAQTAQLFFGFPQKILPVEDGTAGNLEIFVQQTEHRLYGHAFSASRFSENAQTFAGMDFKAYLFHQLFGTFTLGECYI